LRVPFVVSWPGRIPRGKTHDGLVISLDIAPTTFAAAGLSVTTADRFDGVNLLPYLMGRASADPQRALFWRFGLQFAVRQGDWKLATWKSDTGDKFTTALYDLKADVGETADVAARHPEVVRMLQSAWNAWNQGNVRPLFGDKIEMEETRSARWAP
jgi:arylsulfatase A-like enzyme